MVAGVLVREWMSLEANNEDELSQVVQYDLSPTLHEESG